MIKEYSELTKDEKIELFAARAICINLPYVIVIIPFLVIALVSKDRYIGIVSTIFSFLFLIGWYVERSNLKKLFLEVD